MNWPLFSSLRILRAKVRASVQDVRGEPPPSPRWTVGQRLVGGATPQEFASRNSTHGLTGHGVVGPHRSRWGPTTFLRRPPSHRRSRCTPWRSVPTRPAAPSAARRTSPPKHRVRFAAAACHVLRSRRCRGGGPAAGHREPAGTGLDQMSITTWWWSGTAAGVPARVIPVDPCRLGRVRLGVEAACRGRDRT